jgi:2-oxoglutarate ferredoxin oxidoreductase subunit alpha
LKAGFDYALEHVSIRFSIGKAPLPKGTYRKITGNEAAALGLVAAASLAGKNLFYGSYPITPASSILETLAGLKNHNVVVFQAEDEIAAMGAAVGAAYAGAIAATGTSGPGMALKTEAIGLAVMTELPVVIIDVQRAGPSTGMPTKPEQSDLYQAILGRNGDCPVVVLAATSPADCFQAAIESVRIAVRYRTPVILLSDGFIANSAEPWLIPQYDQMKPILVEHPTHPEGFMPYARNSDLARPWAIPGVQGLEHRIGSLEKQDRVGSVSHDPLNHQKMTELRMKKVQNIDPPGQTHLWTGPDQGDILLLGWGGSHGALLGATLELQKQGRSAAHCQIRYLNPLPTDLGDKLKKFKKILVCELNMGQLQKLLKAEYGVESQGLHKVQGQPLFVHDILEAL